MKYLVMDVRKVYTDVGGMKKLYHVCLPVSKIIHVHADSPWYNCYVIYMIDLPVNVGQAMLPN